MKQKYHLDNLVETTIPFFQGLGSLYALPTFARWEQEFGDLGGGDMERFQRIDSSYVMGMAVCILSTFTLAAVGCDQFQYNGNIRLPAAIWGGLLLGNVTSTLYESLRPYVFKAQGKKQG